MIVSPQLHTNLGFNTVTTTCNIEASLCTSPCSVEHGHDCQVVVCWSVDLGVRGHYGLTV